MSNIFAYEIEIGIFKNKLKNYGMLKERLKLLNTDLEYIENHRYNIRSTSLIKSGTGSTNKQTKIDKNYKELKVLEDLQKKKAKTLEDIKDIEDVLNKIPNSEYKKAMIDAIGYGERTIDVIEKYKIAYSVKGLLGCFDRLIMEALKKKGGKK